jgi:hypothetical protein
VLRGHTARKAEPQIEVRDGADFSDTEIGIPDEFATDVSSPVEGSPLLLGSRLDSRIDADVAPRSVFLGCDGFGGTSNRP